MDDAGQHHRHGGDRDQRLAREREPAFRRGQTNESVDLERRERQHARRDGDDLEWTLTMELDRAFNLAGAPSVHGDGWNEEAARNRRARGKCRHSANHGRRTSHSQHVSFADGEGCNRGDDVRNQQHPRHVNLHHPKQTRAHHRPGQAEGQESGASAAVAALLRRSLRRTRPRRRGRTTD